MSKSRNKKIWLSPPHLNGEEQQFVQRAFEENWLAPMGPNVDGFEQDLEQFLGDSVYVTALNSGTSAIHLALDMLGVTQGDIVICQSLTFAASAFPITYLGASPLFIDSEPDTWNMDPQLLEKALEDCQTEGNMPKAIIAVHLYGMPYKVEALHKVADRFGIPVIEDSAEALGSSQNGKHCGTFGEFGILSFNGNKIITTSAGGALISRSADQKAESIKRASQAREICTHYEHKTIGYNYRLSNVLAGIGRGQMKALATHIDRKRLVFDQYYEAMKHLFDFQVERQGSFANRWLTCILTRSALERKTLLEVLQQNDIDARPLWKPLHLQPVFKEMKSYTNGVAEDLFERGLCLPSGTAQKPETTNHIIEIVKEAL